MMKLILASNSPRRRELLTLLKIAFEVFPADIDEIQKPGEQPRDYVRRLAQEKARKVALERDGVVIAADTVVVDGEELLGKPANDAHARRMLKQLRGRSHQVFSGIALINTRTGEGVNAVCRTDVLMRDYTDKELDAYIATGNPLDKAGAYAIQHGGFHPVKSLTGCFASVMGLPLCHLSRCLQDLGVVVPSGLPDRCKVYLDYPCAVFSTILGN